MAKLIFEGEKLSNEYSGLGQFCLHLGHELAALQLPGLHFYLPAGKTGLFGSGVGYIRQKALHKFTGVKTAAGDVFHATHQTSKYFPSNKKTAYVLTVHDLNFLYKYTGAKLRRKKKEMQYHIARASAITAISHFAARELKDHMALEGKQVTVIHNGNSLNTAIQPMRPAWMKTDRPFLFTIGVLLPRKNFHVLLPFLQQLGEYRLVMAGHAASPYAQEIRHEAAQRGLQDRIDLPGNITDAEKLWLYQNCTAFVFPSLAEGFGLPVVEAMSQGKPVFLNNATSLPEIGGHEAFYWNDFDAGHMTEVFEKGMRYFEQHKPADRYIRHAAQFTWAQAARAYAKVYAGAKG